MNRKPVSNGNPQTHKHPKYLRPKEILFFEWSGQMVFFLSFEQASFASVESKWMNSWSSVSKGDMKEPSTWLPYQHNTPR